MEQLDWARRLLTHETASGDADSATGTAASRLYDKLVAHMTPLVGAAGVNLLLLRSAKLAQPDFAFPVLPSGDEGVTKLREALQSREPEIGSESAAAFFGIFFALLTTFIGERLTVQVLRRAWPAIDVTALAETDQ